MSGGALRTLAHSEADTEAFGARLARTAPPAAELAIVYVAGELGAGKTTLIRGFLRACGITRAVRSPTYTLVEEYVRPDRTVLHADLYRLRSAAELEPLGLREQARPGFLWLIEWPERGHGALPPADLELQLTAREDAHAIETRAFSPAGTQWLARLTADPVVRSLEKEPPTT